MNLRASILVSVLLAAAGMASLAQETNSVEGLDFDSFKIITQRNIFDPTRTGRRVRREPQRRVEFVRLAGIVIDPKEEAVQFTGSGVPDKFLKVGDSVKDLKVVQITEDGARLKEGQSNAFVLDFEKRTSLRREENGPWQVSSDTSDPAPVASANSDEAGSSASTPAAKPASGTADSITEMLKKRRSEEK
ncbi:MAG: hypothetical protein ACLQVY_11660 [Limisphaerales bacterium]